MKVVGIFHPCLGAGGSEACAMVLLEVLQNRCETTLVTGAPFECARLNNAYQTRVDENKISVRIVPMPGVVREAAAGDALRGAFFARYVRKVSQDFDLCISAYNFAPFGRPAIQFIADFSWDEEMRRAYDPVLPGLRGVMQRPTPLRSAYLGLCDLIGGRRFDPRDHALDVVVANSRWTADILERRHGLRTRVIYPPVHTPSQIDWSNDSGDFVLLGRIAPEKRVVEAIEVLDRVRRRGHSFQLHIIGPMDASEYCERVRQAAETAGNWVRLRGALYGDDKFAELGRHTFGLHMRQREAFGIAVAEMIKMGLVPFVCAGSAPTEIVADDRLTFQDLDSAVDLIDSMLRDGAGLAETRAKLAVRADLFSTERMAAEARTLVQEVAEWGFA